MALGRFAGWWCAYRRPAAKDARTVPAEREQAVLARQEEAARGGQVAVQVKQGKAVRQCRKGKENSADRNSAVVCYTRA